MTSIADVRFPRDLASMMLVEVSATMALLLEAEIGNYEDRPLPAGLLKCGQTIRFLSVLQLLLRQRFPEFEDPLVLERAISDFAGTATPLTLN